MQKGQLRRCNWGTMVQANAMNCPAPLPYASPAQSPKKGGVGLDGADVCSVAIRLGFMSMPLVFRGTTR